MAKSPEPPRPDDAGKSPPDITPDEMATEIERRIGSLVSGKQRDQVLAQVLSVVYSERFSGPMPHPRHFRDYEDILPGSAERILRMAENAQEHNRQMEGAIVHAQIADQKRGMNFGFAALLVILSAAAFFAFFGNNIAAGLFLTTAVLGAIPVFVKGRWNGN